MRIVKSLISYLLPVAATLAVTPASAVLLFDQRRDARCHFRLGEH